MRAFRPVLILALATASLVPGISSASHELAPNPGFEASPTGAAGDAAKQPIIPTGWAFEGAAGLFDHAERFPNSGKRMAAISIPASTNRRICQQDTCVNSPLTTATDVTDLAYTVGPYWRTVSPVRVTAGKSYSFKVYTSLSLATIGAGAKTLVRWVDVNGVPVGVTAGPKRVQLENDSAETAWEQISKTITAPARAQGAIIMLGAIDDLFISQIRFDDVSFRQTTAD